LIGSYIFITTFRKIAMKRLLLVLILASSMTLPMTAEAGIIRDAGRSCVFGAALLATSTYLGLTPRLLSTGPLALPFTLQSATASNALVGCGMIATASTVASVFTVFYDALF
jgi:hypothetical protein